MKKSYLQTSLGASFALAAVLLASEGSMIQKAQADETSAWDAWLDQVTEIQSEQPAWITPLVTVTPRLEQEFRTDFVGKQSSSGSETYVFGNGKGLEAIPFALPIEVLVNVPPYLEHNSSAQDGFGDFSFMFKYRILSVNRKNGDYILTAFLGMSLPTATASNGNGTSIVTPTIAGGKGYGPFDVQSTLGIALPANETTTLGHTLNWNTALQYHVDALFWPELEDNYAYHFGGSEGGNTENYVTPGLVLGRVGIHERTGFTFGGGYQIATSHDNSYGHAWIASLRMPF